MAWTASGSDWLPGTFTSCGTATRQVSSLRSRRRPQPHGIGRSRPGHRPRQLTLAQHELMGIAQLPGRLDAQFLDQHAASIAVDGQGLRLPPAPVQREHQLSTQPLAQRMLADERLQLTDKLGVASQSQVGIDPVGDSRNPQLVQPADRGLGERLVVDIGERRAAPHAQRPRSVPAASAASLRAS